MTGGLGSIQHAGQVSTAWSVPAWDRAQRMLDVALVVITAFLWAPCLLLITALKYLVDGGPILFRHERLGRNGRPFSLYKITTTPADYQPSPEDWPRDGFPPRTRFGQWLRRVDLDELPQLWNVLRGDMSLVGPRPETPYHSHRLGLALDAYGERLQVLPGLTGLAQVRGWRGDTNMAMRLASDLEYIGSRGPRMYVRVLGATLGVEGRRAWGGGK